MQVNAVRKKCVEEVEHPGDYCIFNLSEEKPNSGISFVCPYDGCGDKSHLPLRPPLERGWQWNDLTNTLSPSIKRMDESRCEHHFSLIDGKWVP